MRLIDADKLKAAIIYDNKIHCGIVFQNVILHLNNAKTIDAEPVRHGKWEICCDGYYPYCSVCKEEPIGRKMSKYCPNCGTKMDLEGAE